MIPEDQHLAIVFYVVAAVAGIYGTALVWIIKRVLGLERQYRVEHNLLTTRLAVLAKGQDDLKEAWIKADNRNDMAHNKIMDKLDSLERRIKNGQK